MKFLLVLAALAPLSASAEPSFWCGSRNSDLSVNFSTDSTQAIVQTGSGDELRMVALLQCVNVDAKTRADQAYLDCGFKGGEYSVQLNQASGAIEAVVTQKGHPAAVLSCGRN